MPSGLRTQILFIALFPPLLVAMALGLYLAYNRQIDLQIYTEERAHNMALQLAVNARAALERSDTNLLQELGNASLEENGVRAISFYRHDGQRLAHSGPALKLPPTMKQLSGQESVTGSNNNIYSFSTPVFRNIHTASIADTTPENHHINGWIVIEYNRDNITLRQHQEILTEALLMLAALLISGSIGFLLAQRIVTDIRSLNNAIKRIKEGDPANLPVMSSSTDIAGLANNIADMADHLDKEFNDMQHNLEVSANDLKETIETIEIQNIELNLAKKEALTASKVKSEFLANTSHEIRTPLNGIIGFARILQKTPLNKQQKDYVETIQQSSENLLAIINDVLDFSKIEAGKLELEMAPLNLRHVLEECITLFAPHAYEKNVEMVLMIYQDVPLHITGDSLRIKQVISNLLSNAVKFTRQGTIAVRVSLEHSDNEEVELKISVSDTGVGMTAEQQRNIFQAFTQANSSISREFGGTGLGLAIVKRLVELMHGDILVESSPDHGSNFSFILKTRINEQQDTFNYRHLSKKTALIIEHHDLLRLSISHLLSGRDMNTLTASTINEATLLLAEHHADIILLGLSINEAGLASQIDGIAQLNRHSIPLLLLATNGMEDQLQHLPSGNISITFKPLTEARLFHSLYEIVYPQDRLIPANRQGISSPETGPHQLHILAVDDQQANLKLLKVLLTDIGMTVTTANDGQEAIKKCEENDFDLVFMDIQMPIMNGLNATQVIRSSDRRNATTPIIALTAHALADEKDAIMKAGMNDYITKPINEEQLKSILGKWCKQNLANPPAIPPVDIALCLKLANFKPELAVEMFTMLVEKLSDELDQARLAMEAGHSDHLLEIIHKLHGACCYTGVPALKSAAQRFEYAIKSGETATWPGLYDSLEKAVGEVMAWHLGQDIRTLLQAS